MTTVCDDDADNAAGPSNGTTAAAAIEEGPSVREARQKFRVIEDFGVATVIQDDEFVQHYDKNRIERRVVGSDTKLSKTEQKLEDVYAAEYWEQVRLDREKEDAKLAEQLQNELNRSEQGAQEEQRLRDEDMARRLQEREQQRIASEHHQNRNIENEDAALAARLAEQLKIEHEQQLNKDEELARRISRKEEQRRSSGGSRAHPPPVPPPPVRATEQSLIDFNSEPPAYSANNATGVDPAALSPTNPFHPQFR